MGESDLSSAFEFAGVFLGSEVGWYGVWTRVAVIDNVELRRDDSIWCRVDVVTKRWRRGSGYGGWHMVLSV